MIGQNPMANPVRLVCLLLIGTMFGACSGAKTGPVPAPGDGGVDATDGGAVPSSADQDIAAVRAACIPADQSDLALLEPWPANGPGTVEPVPIAHPRTPDIVYVLAGPAPASLRASVDGAKSFCRLPAPSLDWLVIAPSSPSVLFAGFGNQLFTSNDAGRTWDQVGTVGTASNPVGNPVLVHPRRPDLLFTVPRADVSAAPGTVSFEQSNDGGRSWSAVGLAGLPLVIKSAQLAVGQGAGVLFLTVQAEVPGDPAAQSRLHVSRDGGATWVARELPTSDEAALLVANDGRLLLTAAGLWTSVDDGATWQSVALSPVLTEPRAFAPADAPAGMFYVTGFIGPPPGQFTILKTITGGNSWIEVPPPEGTMQPSSVPASVGQTLYLPSRVGVFRTQDNGSSWDLRWLDVHRAIAASVDGLFLFTTLPGGLFFSNNGGQTWSARPTKIAAIAGAVGPGKPPTLYLTGASR